MRLNLMTLTAPRMSSYQCRKIPSDRAVFDPGGVVGLNRPDLRSWSRRSGLFSPTSTSIQVRTFRLWYYTNSFRSGPVRNAVVGPRPNLQAPEFVGWAV